MSDRPLAATETTRRQALGAISFLAAAAAAPAVSAQMAGSARRAASAVSPLALAGAGYNAATGEYVLPALPYDYDALEPFIDEQTMRIHHDKHHAGYVRGANKAVAALAKARRDNDNDLIKYWTHELSFNGSGHANHSLFWITMAPKSQGGGELESGDLAHAIETDFGSFDQFSDQFQAAARTVEGSGWGWLVFEPISERLMIMQGEKQQNMLMSGVTPLLGVDVWEHAYYIKYQNRRAEYVKNFMNIINWKMVAKLYAHARSIA